MQQTPQNLTVPGADTVLQHLRNGPIPMSRTVASVSADIRELIRLGLAIYRDGALHLCNETELDEDMIGHA